MKHPKRNTGTGPLPSRPNPINTNHRRAPSGRGRPRPKGLILPAPAPAGKVAVTYLDAQGKPWRRDHLDERLWTAIEALAEREGVTTGEIVSRAIEDALNAPEGTDAYLAGASNRRGGGF